MKAGWTKQTLGESCDFIGRGIAPKYVEEGGVRVINQKCIRGHQIDFSLARRHDVASKRVPTERIIRIGDVLVNSTGTGTLGRVAQVRTMPDEPTTVDTHVTIVRPKAGLFHLEFFGHALISIEAALLAGGVGASGQTELPRTDLEKKYSISYPTALDEQKRIVAILDEAFEGLSRARANAEANFADARELFEAAREVHFTAKLSSGWRLAKLSELISIKHGFAFKSVHFSDQGALAVLTPGNFFESGGFRARGDKQRYYTGDFPKEFLLSPGDLLVAMTEQAPGLLGSCIIVPGDGHYLHNQRLGLLQPLTGTTWNARFFAHVFNISGLRRGLSDTCSGATVRHTSPGRILAQVIPYCDDADELERAADDMDMAKALWARLSKAYQAQLDDLETLRRALLQETFTGELA